MPSDPHLIPKGWHAGPWEMFGRNMTIPEDRPVYCDDCGWVGRESTMWLPFAELDDLRMRLCPGSEVPAGECGDGECGGLCYYDDQVVAWRLKPGVLDALAEALDEPA